MVTLPQGTKIEIPEADYLYGVGPLRLQVAAVLGVREQGGEQWVRLCGDVIRPDGRRAEHREALVKASALRPLFGR